MSFCFQFLKAREFLKTVLLAVFWFLIYSIVTLHWKGLLLVAFLFRKLGQLCFFPFVHDGLALLLHMILAGGLIVHVLRLSVPLPSDE